MLEPLTAAQTVVQTLGEPKIPSPFKYHQEEVQERHILYDPYWQPGKTCEPICFESSLPSAKVYFDPRKVTAAIVTCGGICPGLNDVIRSIVLRLWHGYGVRKIFGAQFGLQGFVPEFGLPFLDLTPEAVTDIHELGGTVLGSSRGQQDIDQIVDTLDRQGVNILFVIGGDGSLRAAQKIQEEVAKRDKKIGVVAVPKTIDNDISFISRSFGFETAVDAACEAIKCAHAEAKSFPLGIGLVKLMGRYSGFIAAAAALSQRDVNYVLVPEVDFDLEGPHGLLADLEERLKLRQHAVIVVAEGAGQKYFEGAEEKRDASGNLLLQDIGIYLREQMKTYFKDRDMGINLKYIDPSYMIRSIPANTADGLYCATLGQNAVHAAMVGKTGMVVSVWHGVYCNIPISLAVSKRKTLHDAGRMWRDVLESTGQPSFVEGGYNGP
ncbi:MAG: ATP-dependent 6-phosphofructokinase [bacterium]|nr:ATP-dependent 6-phosphofructokinase [bacterium]